MDMPDEIRSSYSEWMLIDKVEKKGGLSLQRLMNSPHPTKSICFIF